MAIVAIAGSCGNTEENTVEFETLTLDKAINLTNEELSPTCTVSLKMENAIEKNGHRAEVINNTVIERLLNMRDMSMKTAMEEFTENYIKSYKSTMVPLYNQDRADTTKRAWYEFHYIISAETQQGSKNTIVYLATVDYYEGGAHGTQLRGEDGTTADAERDFCRRHRKPAEQHSAESAEGENRTGDDWSTQRKRLSEVGRHLCP